MSYKETVTEIMRNGRLRQYAFSCKERKWTKFVERMKHRLFEIIEICKVEGRLFKLTIVLMNNECLTLDQMSQPTKDVLVLMLDKATHLLPHSKIKTLYVLTAIDGIITQEDTRDLMEESDRLVVM